MEHKVDKVTHPYPALPPTEGGVARQVMDERWKAAGLTSVHEYS